MKSIKKILIMTAVFLITIGTSSFAQEAAKTEDFYYVYVPVVKVLTQPEGYVVFYRKQGVTLKQALIPLNWFKANSKKAVLTTLMPGEKPALTIFYRDGEVDLLRLSMPKSLLDSAWGVAPQGLVDIEKFNVEKFVIEY